MKTLILDKPQTLRFLDTESPVDVPAGHALVRVHRVGICGTDWHAYHGRQPFFSYPRILGHELGVEVLELNDPAAPLKPGDRCSVEPYLNCRTCIACRAGKGNCCVNLKVLGVHADGGMRELLVVPTRKLHASAKLSFDQLALVETLGIGCHAVARANVRPGEQVLVLGAGPIGLSVVPFVTAAGAVPIVADVSDSRLALCKKLMGVEATVDARGDLVQQLTEHLSGDLPTAVIDATGNPGSMGKCFDLVAHGGRIVFVGLHRPYQDPINIRRGDSGRRAAGRRAWLPRRHRQVRPDRR